MRKSLFAALLLLRAVTVPAQTTFQKTYGGSATDYGMFIEQTFDGGYAFAGTGNGFVPSGNGNICLVKLTASGDTSWIRILGMTSSAEQVLGGHQTADSGYILCGAYGSGPFQSFMMKTDKNGGLVWEKRYSTNNNTSGQAVRQTPDGGFIMVGATASGPVGSFLVVRTNASGDTLWTRRCTQNNITLGGAFSVQNTSDGGFVMTGYTYEFMNGPGYEILLVKLDASGNVMWMKMFGGVGHDYASNVVQTADGGYILTGHTMSFGAGQNDFLVIKTDSAGVLQWSKTYGSADEDIPTRIRQTPDGGYIVAGYSQGFGGPDGNFYVVKTDASGNHQWSKRYGVNSVGEECYGLDLTDDGGYILAGRGGRIYVVKTDASGNSGCNEVNTATIVSNPALNVFTPVPQVARGCTVTVLTPVMTNPVCTVTTLCAITGMHEKKESELTFSISPNPSFGSFTVTCNEDIKRIEIYNMLGKRIFYNTAAPSSATKHVEIDLQGCAPGLYMIQLENEKGWFAEKLLLH